ncbi:MAG: hypothetical protein ACW964_20530 [Candidatus Hodarchaeales archaeon]
MTVLNVGRIILGIFYLIACFFNLFHTINNTEYLWTICLDNVRFPIQREFLEIIVIPNEKIIVLLIVALEFVMGILILNQGIYVKIGLVLGILWVLFAAQFLPMNDIIGHLILGIIQALLLLENYDLTLIEIIQSRLFQN